MLSKHYCTCYYEAVDSWANVFIVVIATHTCTQKSLACVYTQFKGCW